MKTKKGNNSITLISTTILLLTVGIFGMIPTPAAFAHSDDNNVSATPCNSNAAGSGITIFDGVNPVVAVTQGENVDGIMDLQESTDVGVLIRCAFDGGTIGIFAGTIVITNPDGSSGTVNTGDIPCIGGSTNTGDLVLPADCANGLSSFSSNPRAYVVDCTDDGSNQDPVDGAVRWTAVFTGRSHFNDADSTSLVKGDQIDLPCAAPFTPTTNSSKTETYTTVSNPSDTIKIQGVDGIQGSWDIISNTLYRNEPGFVPVVAVCAPDPLSSTGPSHLYPISSLCTSNTGGNLPPGHYYWTAVIQSLNANYTPSTIQTLNGSNVEIENFVVEPPTVTRTIGYWQTHLTQFQNTWPGIAGDPGIINCDGFDVGSDAQALGGMYAGISKNTDKSDRSLLDQARMRLAQQLIGAILNNLAFGSIPGGSISIDDAKDAFCSDNIGDINAAQAAMGAFNQSGDLLPFPLGFVNSNATPTAAKAFANIAFWNFLDTKIIP